MAAPTLADATIIVLKPGESRTTRIDLTQPRWFVTDTKATLAAQKPIALRDITDPWAASFRIEYAVPAKASFTSRPNGELVYRGRVRSRAFNPVAGMD